MLYAKMMIRTFIAIELPVEVKQVVRQIQNRLRESIEGIRWVKQENIHLSVKFLGDVEENRIGKFRDVMLFYLSITNQCVEFRNIYSDSVQSQFI